MATVSSAVLKASDRVSYTNRGRDLYSSAQMATLHNPVRRPQPADGERGGDVLLQDAGGPAERLELRAQAAPLLDDVRRLAQQLGPERAPVIQASKTCEGVNCGHGQTCARDHL